MKKLPADSELEAKLLPLCRPCACRASAPWPLPLLLRDLRCRRAVPVTSARARLVRILRAVAARLLPVALEVRVIRLPRIHPVEPNHAPAQKPQPQTSSPVQPQKSEMWYLSLTSWPKTMTRGRRASARSCAVK